MRSSFFVCLLAALPGVGQAQLMVPDSVVNVAVLALPEGLRADASVMAFDDDGSLITVHQGAGRMVCLDDDPAREGFHIACYHDSLEPFMARGRALRLAGMEREEIKQTREREIVGGTLAMPDHPAALYSMSGPEDCYDADAATLCEARRLYVVYIPYATGESTGLSTDATQGVPWLMDPGEPWAHIMMIPPE